MKTFKADLHIHTVLSPCGDVEMSPVNIVKKALEMKLDIIGITDHNSTLQCELIKELAAKFQLFVLMGAEVTSKEEIHCLAYFENKTELAVFQRYLEQNLPNIPNISEKFGHQLLVNEQEEVLQEIQPLLIIGIDQSINEIATKVYELNGIFIPAHIDKSRNSIVSQLGFIPTNLSFDALEVSSHFKRNIQDELLLKNYDGKVITSSDAHYLHQIGSVYTEFSMQELSFSALQKALKQKTYKPIFNN